MRRMLSTLMRLALALALLAIAAPAEAWPGGRLMHGGPPPGALLDHHAEALGLDGDTREAIAAIVEASHEEGRALRDEVRDARHALRELLRADPVDREAVMAEVERAGELEIEVEKHRIETMLAIRGQLSPEQRAAMVELRERMHERHFGPILEACAEEAEARCEGEGPRAIHCLLRQRDELAGACAEALEGLPGRFGRGRHGERPPPHLRGPAPYEPEG